MRKAFLLLSLCCCCAACESPGPLSKPGVPAAEAERDRLQCQAAMVSERQSKGRGAPNWNLYEYCMKQRGYARPR
jgi:hypothetical protein